VISCELSAKPHTHHLEALVCDQLVCDLVSWVQNPMLTILGIGVPSASCM